jgi:hypothetical protein
MINRFHNAVPSVAIPGANSQANKAKPGDGFALLLNALANPVVEQQPQQNPAELLQEPGLKPELENAAMPFNRLLDAAEVVINPAASNLFLTAPIPGAIAMTASPLLPVTMQMEAASTQEAFSTVAFEVPVATVSIAIGNEVTPASLSSLAISPDSEVQTATMVSSELFVVTEAASIADIAVLTTTNEIKPTSVDCTDTHVSINKRSATQHGDVELVAMPWHLQANAALSYQTTAQRLENVDETQNGSSTVVLATPSYAGNKKPLQNLSSNGSQYDLVKIDKTLEFYRISEEASAIAGAFESARSLRTDSRASFIMWPQRVLHWLADGDSTTAWVRDYQLDASGAKTLVDALRCFAEQQGFSLRRIMLNGHEVWRSPSTF